MPLDIEPDGQQFLDARRSAADEAEAGDTSGGPDALPSNGEAPAADEPRRRRTTAAVLAVLVVVLVAGAVGVVTLTSGGGDRRALETGGGSVEVGDREAATTTARDEQDSTSTTPATTAPPTVPADTATDAQPFPDLVAPPGPDGPAPIPGGPPPVVCPGGGIDSRTTMQVTEKAGQSDRWQYDIQGTSTNNTTAAVIVELTVSITHGDPSHPDPFVVPAVQQFSPIEPGVTSRWRATGQLESGDQPVALVGLGGGFSWADPALSSCPTG